MDTPTFIAKWSKAKLSERAASQEHYIDLCRLLGVQTPTAVDPEGDCDTEWAEVCEQTGAGQPLPDAHALIDQRQEVEQLILGNLLRMNLSRSM